ncbi:hypothetical protein QJS10_CPA07g00927 [Acorus calamus]|uniref:Neprosin PEP catalytic domain-containing protein n=1 Tax=Acorus calamus TaxID=4465 RepID=A0AAV9EF87_ACOCL|nr:hypothetical protein QJS10_CPA07g00927 [Acorus calamus]
MRAVSPNIFNKKYPNEVFHPQAGNDQKNHEAEINIWNPRVEPGDFSIAALSVTTREIQTYLSAGWMVDPNMYGDNQTRIFTYWTVDGSVNTGCYNHGCSGFVQVNNVIALGGTATPISVYDGPQYQMAVSIFKDVKTGHWWLQMQGNAIGYWPSSLVPRLANGAEVVQYGGEVFDSGGNGGGHTTTEMGSGHFGGEGERKASVFKNIQVVDPAKNEYVIPQQIFGFADRKSCYDLTAARVTQNWGLYFFYGGPGRNPNCP